MVGEAFGAINVAAGYRDGFLELREADGAFDKHEDEDSGVAVERDSIKTHARVGELTKQRQHGTVTS